MPTSNKANAAVKELAECKNCLHIDLNIGLTDKEDRLKKEFAIEGIQMYPNGYQNVFENFIPIIQSLYRMLCMMEAKMQKYFSNTGQPAFYGGYIFQNICGRIDLSIWV